MKPKHFPQANSTLLGGPAENYGTDLDVSDLPVYRGGGEIISCWRPSWRERLRVLVGGSVFLRVATTKNHPPVSLDAGRVFLAAILLVGCGFLAPPAFAQDCIATLSGCDACVQPSGAITVSNCGATTGCPGFPSSLLTREPVIEPGSLHEILAQRLREVWGGSVSAVMLDPRRSFVRRAALELLTENPAVSGSAENWRSAADRRVYVEAADCLAHAKAVKPPGSDPVAIPRSTSSRGCASATRAWLFRQLGTFPPGVLDPFVETGESLTAEPDDDLAGLAAQIRELGGGEAGALELLLALEFAVHEVGEDEEGGRR